MMGFIWINLARYGVHLWCRDVPNRVFIRYVSGCCRRQCISPRRRTYSVGIFAVAFGSESNSNICNRQADEQHHTFPASLNRGDVIESLTAQLHTHDMHNLGLDQTPAKGGNSDESADRGGSANTGDG